MRRVPFKIEIGDPLHGEYVELFKRACDSCSMQFRPDVIEAFIEKHYQSKGRPMRRCHPRDLLAQVVALSAYHGERPELRMDYLDMACRNYFGASTAAISKEALATRPTRAVPLSPPNAPSLGISKTVNRPSLIGALPPPVTDRGTVRTPISKVPIPTTPGTNTVAPNPASNNPRPVSQQGNATLRNGAPTLPKPRPSVSIPISAPVSAPFATPMAYPGDTHPSATASSS